MKQSIEDIVAEMRERARKWLRPEQTGLAETLEGYADRIEAALERKRYEL